MICDTRGGIGGPVIKEPDILFDAYRDAPARKIMIEFVQSSRFMDERAAIAALRELNEIGLAYVYRDALTALYKPTQIDYDPLQIGRR